MQCIRGLLHIILAKNAQQETGSDGRADNTGHVGTHSVHQKEVRGICLLSFLIGNTVRRNTKEFIVSFAEMDKGHVGTVYQATNWLYTGLSAKRTDWVVEGIDLHGQTWGDKHTVTEMRALYGDRFYLKPRPRKHRYVFVNAKGGRRRALTRAIRYSQEPYPKAARP